MSDETILPMGGNYNLVVTKEILINQITRRVNEESMVVQKIYNELEKLFYEYFKSASPIETVEIRPFEGFIFKCEHEEEKKKFHPGRKEYITQAPRLWIKPRVTRNYNKKLNEER